MREFYEFSPGSNRWYVLTGHLSAVWDVCQ